MSQILHCESRLTHFNLKIMERVIKSAQKQFGGKGLLKTNKVKGYFESEKADIVFQFDGMNFPMGILQRNGKVEFVGDPWGSENWDKVKETIEQKYVLTNAAITMRAMGFSIESERLSKPQGTVIQGVRT